MILTMNNVELDSNFYLQTHGTTVFPFKETFLYTFLQLRVSFNKLYIILRVDAILIITDFIEVTKKSKHNIITVNLRHG